MERAIAQCKVIFPLFLNTSGANSSGLWQNQGKWLKTASCQECSYPRILHPRRRMPVLDFFQLMILGFLISSNVKQLNRANVSMWTQNYIIYYLANLTRSQDCNVQEFWHITIWIYIYRKNFKLHLYIFICLIQSRFALRIILGVA